MTKSLLLAILSLSTIYAEAEKCRSAGNIPDLIYNAYFSPSDPDSTPPMRFYCLDSKPWNEINPDNPRIRGKNAYGLHDFKCWHIQEMGPLDYRTQGIIDGVLR